MKWGKVVVSGARGFIGSHLIAHLRQMLGPDSVFGLTRDKTSVSRHTLYCDFSNPRHTAQVLRKLRPSVLFHAAGGSRGTFQEMMDGNIFTTLHIFEALSMAPLRMRTVILGSAAEYGNAKGSCRADKTLLRPLSPYAWTKACQTLLAEQAAASGLDVVVARLFNFTGPGIPSRFAVGAFAKQIAESGPNSTGEIRVGNLNSYRDFLDIRDAVQAIVQIAKRGTSGRTYDVCSGISVSMNHILNLLFRCAGKKLKVRRISEKKRQDVPFSLGDPRAVIHLGWKPTFSLKKSLQDTLLAPCI